MGVWFIAVNPREGMPHCVRGGGEEGVRRGGGGGGGRRYIISKHAIASFPVSTPSFFSPACCHAKKKAGSGDWE